ncbi:adhesion G-protein coupled receptor G7 [Pelodytes ibericus]
MSCTEDSGGSMGGQREKPTDITEDASKIATSAQILTSRPEELNATDISYALQIVNRILDNTEVPVVADVVETAVTTVSQILGARSEEFDRVNSEITQNAESLTMAMEKLAHNNSTSNTPLVQPNVAVQSISLPSGNSNGVLFTSLRGLDDTDTLLANRIIVNENVSQLQVNETAEVQIFVRTEGEGNVGFVLYQNDNFFRSKRHISKINGIKRIISASITNGTAGNIHFIFNPRLNTMHTLVDHTCVYWDYKISDWNTTGCSKSCNRQDFLECSCNHTTNFAVLLSFKTNHELISLPIISFVGCSLSILGLITTILFQILQRKKQQIKWVLVYLCTSMLIFNIIFMAGVENKHHQTTDNNQTCENSTTSSNIPPTDIIQYNDTGPSHFITYSSVIAWGVPAVIVSITLGASYRWETPLNYRQEEFCWLAASSDENTLDFSKPMFWAFLLPLGIILAFNICIFVAVTVQAIWKKTDKLSRTEAVFSKTILQSQTHAPVFGTPEKRYMHREVKDTRRTSFIRKALNTLSVALLLGITWLFGYFMLASDERTRTAFSFIFCILSSTQGLQIFILYTLRSPLFLEKVAAAIRKCHSCRIYMHSDKYILNRIRKNMTEIYTETFRTFEDSTRELFSKSTESEERASL